MSILYIDIIHFLLILFLRNVLGTIKLYFVTVFNVLNLL